MLPQLQNIATKIESFRRRDPSMFQNLVFVSTGHFSTPLGPDVSELIWGFQKDLWCDYQPPAGFVGSTLYLNNNNSSDLYK